ncbi:sensor histidine kinase [Enterovibrio sp. ZSDZ42]|uniref:histidine kinase n=1 Tax=Enterovibrio gelatinilyticus TaxID=2899819 RepID=A0ABT5R537_9GAMM|nr:sensor histidine kinase [Enterovibrio sp. ZSDZ42]MDD1795398.1 sensor histidine kinase [Enterovibrio sp. ZSDZ42]
MLPLFSVKAALFIIIGICCFCPCPATAGAIQHYDVGVLALRGDDHAKKSWQPTLHWLESQIPNTTFEMHTYDFDELDDAFRHNQLDFLLTSPGQATKIARQYQLNWLATQKTAYSSNSTHSIASVVVVRSDSPYQTLKDIERASIAAVSEKAFGGFLALRYELDKLDFFSRSFFRNIQFTGPPTDKLLLDVLDKSLDVAIVPACTLENMVKEGLLQRDQFRVLEKKHPHDSVCAVTTALYPNWTLAKTTRASNEIGKKVTQALLSLPEYSKAAAAAGNIGWTLPASSVHVDKVFQHLDMHPLQASWQEGLFKWLTKNQLITFGIVLFLIILNVYHFWLEYHFNRSKKDLERTLFDLKEKNTMLEHAQRTMIVGELGSSIAHEINQPLSTIKNYSEGIQRRLDQGMTAEELAPFLGKIHQQVGVAGDIVQRLRSLIKRTPSERVICDPAAFIKESLELIEFDFQALKIDLKFSEEGTPIQGEFDYIGMQQVMLNLLRNAKEACLANLEWDTSPGVSVELLYGENDIVIRVADNGIGLEANEETLKEPFFTTKQDGLGLGLAICRDVIDAHHGHFIIQPARPKGCEVTVIIPIKREQK